MVAETKRRVSRARSIQGSPEGRSCLITIQRGSASKPPLFCVHAEAGDVSLYYGLAGELAPAQPVLGLCAPPAGEPGSAARFEQMAERHVHEIRSAQPSGPYLIAGECTGGALAYEIARQLRSSGEEVALLALVDAFAPGLPRLRRLMPRPAYRILHRARILGFHLGKLARLNMGGRLDYVVAKAGRAWTKSTAKASDAFSRSRSMSPRLAFRDALAAYRPAPYTGPVVLLRAARLPIGIRPSPDLGWAALVENLEVETIPGYFGTPISQPGVRILGERLARRLT